MDAQDRSGRRLWILSVAAVWLVVLGFWVPKVGGVESWPSWLFTGIMAFGALYLLVMQRSLANQARRDRAELLAGQHWAHWQYDPDTWQRFAAAEWARRRRQVVPWSLGAAAFSLVVVWLASEKAGSWPWDVGQTVLACLVVGGVVGAGVYVDGWQVYRTRLGRPQAVYIGPRGIYQHGNYIPFRPPGPELRGVELVPGDPAALCFRLKYGRWARSFYSTVRVAVPRGREEEAATLVERFAAELAR